MTNERRPDLPTWEPPQPPGYLESMDAIGSVAAPLLAGVAFTMIAVLLPDANRSPGGDGPAGFARWPDATLASLAVAGFLLVSTVQATAWVRRYQCTPDQLKMWWPERHDCRNRPDAWLRRVQADQLNKAVAWAERARVLFHAGILFLLASIAMSAVPHGSASAGRWALLVVTWGAVGGEVYWILYAEFTDPARRRLAVADVVVVIAAPVAVLLGVLTSMGELSPPTATSITTAALLSVTAGAALAAPIAARIAEARWETYLRTTLVATVGLGVAFAVGGDAGRWISAGVLVILGWIHLNSLARMVRLERQATT